MRTNFLTQGGDETGMGLTEKPVWDLIDQGIAGSNVDLVLSDGNCKVMNLSDVGTRVVMMVTEGLERAGINSALIRIVDTCVDKAGTILKLPAMDILPVRIFCR